MAMFPFHGVQETKETELEAGSEVHQGARLCITSATMASAGVTHEVPFPSLGLRMHSADDTELGGVPKSEKSRSKAQ